MKILMNLKKLKINLQIKSRIIENYGRSLFITLMMICNFYSRQCFDTQLL